MSPDGPAGLAAAEHEAGETSLTSPAAPAGTVPARTVPARTVAARTVAALRYHWLAAALLSSGLALRVLAQFAYRPALFYIDTSRYLYDSQGMDPVGYEGPLRAILAVANFGMVAAAQHLLGLAMAIVIYLLMLRRGVPRWLAALAIAPVLLDAYQVQAEQAIMPTAWFEALIVTALAILLWSPGTTWRRTISAGIALGTSATFAQVGEALILPAMIYLVVAVRAEGGGWLRAIGRSAAIGGACLVPILTYSAGSALNHSGFFLSHSGITSFYGRMAAAADCATLRVPAAERAMCPTPAQQAEGPDWLEYNDASPVRPIYDRLPRGQVDAMIADFDHAVLTQQPLRVLAAYGHDVAKVFVPVRTGSPGDTPITRWQFQTTFPYFQSHSTPPEVAAEISQFGGGKPAVWLPVATFLRGYQLDGGYTPGPLLAICVLAGLIGSVAVSRRRISDRTRQLALGASLCFLSGVSLLLISDLFEFSWRYQIPALVTLVPAGALGLAAILSARRDRAATS